MFGTVEREQERIDHDYLFRGFLRIHSMHDVKHVRWKKVLILSSIP
jgi:hypothetical protein